uniref:Uncharacterized protein n=1 Tax=Cannabis sativa TaxID=3483 RepID=A0A803QBP2_CANSA
MEDFTLKGKESSSWFCAKVVTYTNIIVEEAIAEGVIILKTKFMVKQESSLNFLAYFPWEKRLFLTLDLCSLHCIEDLCLFDLEEEASMVKMKNGNRRVRFREWVFERRGGKGF